MAKKPVIEIVVADIDFVGVDQGIQGAVRIILETESPQEVALVLRPEAYAKLESMLEAVREEMAGRSRPQ
jgi:ribosomal 30S subunit maturation factor RimM